MRDTGRDPERPSPDALLAAARREARTRGRLKIFLGAAPGVGKTYEMLTVGRARLRAGTDVVVAWPRHTAGPRPPPCSTASRSCPARPCPITAPCWRRWISTRCWRAGRRWPWWTNSPTPTRRARARHRKRHQDVEELLDAGIDVLTTLNIQHVESLNDVVAGITRIRVRETVPDGILDRADDIEVVDLNPDDLIQRLKDGKVYVPEGAERALAHYFSRGNLTALRELALRRTADRVDDELLGHMRANAIPGPWAAGERVLVCISDDPRSAALVRYAKRLADRLHAPWTALFVEGTRAAALGEAARDRVAEALRLADRLGGDAVTLPGGRRVADDILAHARSANVNHVVVGKAERSWAFELLHGSVVHDLVRRSGPISVHVVPGEALPGENLRGRAGASGGSAAVATAPPGRGCSCGPTACPCSPPPPGSASPCCSSPRPASRMPTSSCSPRWSRSRCASVSGRRSPRSSPRRSPTTSSSCPPSTP